MNKKGSSQAPIVMLCPACSGDMRCISAGRMVLPRYVCLMCRRIWKYIGGGWALVSESPVAR